MSVIDPREFSRAAGRHPVRKAAIGPLHVAIITCCAATLTGLICLDPMNIVVEALHPEFSDEAWP
ncbi:hypothetical protein [Pseudogemmobacter faecipullorum]|uniref:MFS transporter n=1 Tax=Pseudogemmobacter faecipullorum TaxID=2755041 RepID=A0ABS8CQZ9_9RHOB|nr:hypothetical protein [Pseudogemmobacter faecipullorum]MCB5411814.1 hypothetical protein [Pseudogemmobacter faecipullorum]